MDANAERDAERNAERERRLEELPEHEKDGPADYAGAGVMSTGGTAVDRGTGELSGVAQGPAADDDDADAQGVQPPASRPAPAGRGGATPGIVDYTSGDEDAEGDGIAGERPLDMNRRPGDLA